MDGLKLCYSALLTDVLAEHNAEVTAPSMVLLSYIAMLFISVWVLAREYCSSTYAMCLLFMLVLMLLGTTGTSR